MPDTSSAKPTPPPPCRLHAILARAAPIGVIFRRGPSKRVQLLHWNTDTDAFTPGQWFHGRIYEHRSRLSANGTLLMYDAMKLNRRTLHEEGYKKYGASWTAISKPPYLTALTLWASGTSSGRVRSSEIDWFSRWEQADKPQPDFLPQTSQADTHRNDGISGPAGLVPHLVGDGWEQTQPWQGEFIKSALSIAFQERMNAGLPLDMEWIRSLGSAIYEGPSSRYVTHAPSIYEKPQPRQDAALVMTLTLNGFEEKYHYSVRHSGGKITSLTGAEWADWDIRGRLVLAQNGGIFAQDAVAIGHEPPVELINLNGNTPKPTVAPDWAKTW